MLPSPSHDHPRGSGHVELASVKGRTEIVRSRAHNPLKLLCPRRQGNVAWVIANTYGGGLVAGDETTLAISLQGGANAILGTQASTKVYRSPNQVPCRQLLTSTVSADATLVVTPDPVTCFANAVYEQKQLFDITEGGNLLVLDWITSGRRARGECWAFTRYMSQLEICYGSDLVLSDAMLLDPADGPLDGPFRLAEFHCLAIVAIVGNRFREPGEALLEGISSQPIQRNAPVIDAASPIRHGVVWRIAGTTTELVAKRLQQRLSFLESLMGETPWARKW